jgi:hypothetical protein
MRTLWILLFVILLPVSAHTEEDSALQPGAWALQFQITEDFTLDDFQGSIVSVKVHSSATSAWRAGLELDFSSAETSREGTESGVPRPGSTSEFSTSSATLGLQYVRYANPGAQVVFLFGGGPFFGFDNRSVAYTSEDPIPRDGEDSLDGWSVGISGLVGVEWLVTSRIGIHAEYGFEYEHAEATEKIQRDDFSDTRDSDSDSFGARSVLLGVSAYF